MPDQPYVPASRTLPEITGRAIVLGVVLSLVMAAANAYLGLFAGLTVSASIPAAVVSMSVLRFFRDANILENNGVQTAASSGESLAAGVIFTIPALVMMGVWSAFSYWEVTLIAGFGGLLGVLFSIPLRRALVVDMKLRFPEGVATAEVLKVGHSGGRGIRYLALSGAIGAGYKLGGLGFRLWPEALEWARFAGGTLVYAGSNLSPALIGVGYIVGLNVAVVIFAGGVLNWWIAIPILAAGADPVNVAAVDLAGTLWSTQTRYLGVGAMVVGGLWALMRLRHSLWSGIQSGLRAFRATGGTGGELLRTERDAPMPAILITIAISVVPLFAIFLYFTGNFIVSVVMAAIMLVAGFLFAAVAGYMAGIVGSSNNPISGVTIATLLFAALVLAVLMGTDDPAGPAAAIFIAAVVACSAAISGDNLQDLKSGHLLGATPVKQQFMQTLGVVASAFVMAPVLTLLHQAYGIGVVTTAHPNPLAAPQATLMAAVASGVFGGSLPWSMVLIGMGIALAVIVLDAVLERRQAPFRVPVLAVAVGIYLPFELEVPILIGGLIAWLAGRALTRRAAAADERLRAEQHGLLFAAGLITGEALVGIAMAVPIVLTSNPDVLALGLPSTAALGLLLLSAVIVGLYRTSSSATQAPTPGP